MFSILLVNLKFHTWNLYKSDRFCRSRMKLFFGKFSNKSVNFGDKNWCFCEKPKYFVSKSTPSISRIFSPKTRHSICDHLELIFTEKKHKKWTKLTIFSYFVMTNFSNTSMSNLPLKILTSSKNHINFRQTFH